jgi:hypothetical protein
MALSVSQAARPLFLHPLFGSCTSDPVAFQFEVVVEAGCELVAIHRKLLEPLIQIKQVTVLARL